MDGRKGKSWIEVERKGWWRETRVEFVSFLLLFQPYSFHYFYSSISLTFKNVFIHSSVIHVNVSVFVVTWLEPSRVFYFVSPFYLLRGHSPDAHFFPSCFERWLSLTYPLTTYLSPLLTFLSPRLICIHSQIYTQFMQRMGKEDTQRMLYPNYLTKEEGGMRATSREWGEKKSVRMREKKA